MKVIDIINNLETIAPSDLAEDGDKIGLQVGSFDKEVKKISVCLDTSSVEINAAIENKSDLIIAHHPLIFNPIEQINDSDPCAKRAIDLIKNDISLYIMHTNYDVAVGGINDVLAKELTIYSSEPLLETQQDGFFKIVVFVPDEFTDTVRNAMAEAGAGIVGQYTHCSFKTEGTGSFVPLPAAQPFLGSIGKLEEVTENRLEMICSGGAYNDVIFEMLDKHPYDAVAYDVYPLSNDPIIYGIGRVGLIENEMPLGDFAKLVQTKLNPRYMKVFGDEDKIIKKAAVCGGSGSSLYINAIAAGADVLVTGDTKHHDILNARELGLAIIDAGHIGTEKPGMLALCEKLKADYENSGIEVCFI